MKNNIEIGTFILKVSSACNLNCPYCYVYNKGDTTWQDKPAIMSDDIFLFAINKIVAHCLLSGQKHATFSFHGGEPTLVGPTRFRNWCRIIKEKCAGVIEYVIAIQTNAVRITEEWVSVFREHNVSVGVSMDGPRKIHNLNRIDHKGRGTYDETRRSIELLIDGKVTWGILCVIPIGQDPLAVHEHFMNLGCTNLHYLLPDHTHDTIDPVRIVYGANPVANFLIPIFDDWWFNRMNNIKIRIFYNMARLILGGNSQTDSMGNLPLRMLVIEADGSLEGLDVLRVCGNGFTGTQLNVIDNDIIEICDSDNLHARYIFEPTTLPDDCRTCQERDTCGGGYLPHRWSSSRLFNNPSVWCQDLLKLFNHIRHRLEITPAETARRRLSMPA